ncbi:MAG: MarR family winged helix-turn-helix transcriptional regulator [Vicinamibacteria bacterium]|jgi:DNA-binding MarR family transcriptional regulator
MEATTATAISEEQLAAWRAFLRAHSTMLRRITVDLEEAELPPLSWYDVLAALSDAPQDGALRQVELAERVLLSNSGLSRLIDRIEKAGLVRRTACDTDRRSFYIQLTTEGQEMLERMWPVYARGIAEDFLPALGSNPCEIRQTLESIGAQCDAAKAAEAEPES